MEFRRELGAGYGVLVITLSHRKGCDHPERERVGRKEEEKPTMARQHQEAARGGKTRRGRLEGGRTARNSGFAEQALPGDKAAMSPGRGAVRGALQAWQGAPTGARATEAGGGGRTVAHALQPCDGTDDYLSP